MATHVAVVCSDGETWSIGGTVVLLTDDQLQVIVESDCSDFDDCLEAIKEAGLPEPKGVSVENLNL